MDFLIIEYNRPNQPPLIRSHSVIDDQTPVYLILLVNSEDAVKIIADIEAKKAEFPRLPDQYCFITNAGKIISGEKLYSELAYEEKETDIGLVKVATITISRKIPK